ncbi:MAG: glycosyltransferase [Euryarchaeota archaeon]|nr:glycosyltransferase [Euryarchaeota archaeon]
MFISVIITVKNEAKNISYLLDSLLVQERPFEVIVVDAHSTDGTRDIAQDYASRYNEIHCISYDQTRGESRNYGVKLAKGEVVAFTDGSCIANPFWLKEIRNKILEGYDVIAGNTVRFGFKGFSNVGRVEVLLNGGDASFPTCNIAYRKEVFMKIGGFDPWFKEAEDVDINYRALDSGTRFVYDENAIIYHIGSETLPSFIKKSFWYGFGRKELEIRHGTLWSNYNILDIIRIRKGESWWKLVRLGIAFLGYIFCIFVGRKTETKERLRKAKISQH